MVGQGEEQIQHISSCGSILLCINSVLQNIIAAFLFVQGMKTVCILVIYGGGWCRREHSSGIKTVFQSVCPSPNCSETFTRWQWFEQEVSAMITVCADPLCFLSQSGGINGVKLQDLHPDDSLSCLPCSVDVLSVCSWCTKP